MDSSDLNKYPIGQFQSPDFVSDQEIDNHIKVLKDFPDKLKILVGHLDDHQLDTQYREGGWTVRQVVNHLADCSMNYYIRFKLALTEHNPTVKTFDEQQWAELQDSFTIEIKPALKMIKGIHKRWVYELKSLTNKELESTFHHPLEKRNITLRESTAFCAWHCEHHLAQIEVLKREQNW